jgi:hypothetical protein
MTRALQAHNSIIVWTDRQSSNCSEAPDLSHSHRTMFLNHSDWSSAPCCEFRYHPTASKHVILGRTLNKIRRPVLLSSVRTSYVLSHVTTVRVDEIAPPRPEKGRRTAPTVVYPSVLFVLNYKAHAGTLAKVSATITTASEPRRPKSE